MPDAPGETTLLVAQISGGDPRALSQLVERLYPELRRIAAYHIRRERSGHTLQPTALLNEAFLRLSGREEIEVQDRAHFVALLANAMRHVLIDHARKRAALKRAAPEPHLSINLALANGAEKTFELLQLEKALERLEQADPLKARVVELRFFGGLSVEEIAAVMKITPRTVGRYWSAARLRLYKDLSRERTGDARRATAGGR